MPSKLFASAFRRAGHYYPSYDLHVNGISQPSNDCNHSSTCFFFQHHPVLDSLFIIYRRTSSRRLKRLFLDDLSLLSTCPSQQRLRVFRRNWNCAESASQDSPTSYGGGVQPEVQASKLRTLAARRLPPCRAHVLLQPRAAGVQFARGKVYSTQAII